MTVHIAARIWDDSINHTVGNFRCRDTAIILDGDSRLHYSRVYTTRNLQGWVLNTLLVKHEIG